MVDSPWAMVGLSVVSRWAFRHGSEPDDIFIVGVTDKGLPVFA